MNAIEIPKVEVLPSADELLGNIPASLHFLLTQLLKHDEGLLHAENCRNADEVTWYVRRRSSAGEEEDVAIGELPAGIFGSLLARLALVANIDHQHSGAGRLTLSQDGRVFDCHLFLSKCRESGYWIRLYAHVV